MSVFSKFFAVLFVVFFILGVHYINAQTDTIDYNRRGYNDLMKQDYKSALFNYNKAIEKDANESSYYHNRGVCYDGLGEYQKAIIDFNKALILNDKKEDSYNGLGNTYLNLKEVNEALKCYFKALAINEKSDDTNYNIGYAYTQMQNFKESIRYFKRALEINPQNTEAIHGLPLSLFFLSQYAEAIDGFNQYLKLDSSDVILYAYRADCYLYTEQYENAITDYSRVLGRDDLTGVSNMEKSLWYYSRGRAYAIQSNLQPAIKDYTECILLNPNNFLSYWYRGIAYSLIGDRMNGCADLQMSVKLGFKESEDYLSDKETCDDILKDCK